MIISKTPLRISFFGGGTDYPNYFREHGGRVLSTSIDKYVYVTLSPLSRFFDHRIRVSYSKVELVREVGEIQHPSVRHCLRHFGIEEGVEVMVMSDLPARTGLGSSSSFTVGLLHCLHAFRGEAAAQEALAREATRVEQDLIGESVGCQDQVAAAVGGFNRIAFRGDREFHVEPLALPDARLREFCGHLMLVYTGVARYAEDVVKEQCGNVKRNLQALERMAAQVDEACRILRDPRGDLRAFGELLHEGWTLKRGLSSRISSSLIDDAYAAARRHGASGGKLLGAGGGGFLLLFAPPDAHAKIEAALDKLMVVPFAFETDGTRVIYRAR